MSRLSHPAETNDHHWRYELYRLLFFVLLVKVTCLLIDPNLRLFMGDSASYLHAALTDWDPPDRSITYPMLVALSAVQAQSAYALVALQTLMGVAGCILVYWMLRRAAGLSSLLAGTASFLVAVEPTQLFYERMLMAESVGLLTLLGLLASTVAYVQRGGLRWIPVLVLLGIVTVSFRMSLLPVVLGLSALAPTLRLWHVLSDPRKGSRPEACRRAVFHYVLIAVALFGIHSLYQHAYGERMATSPAYMVAEGQMRIGLLAPLIRSTHFEQVGLTHDFAKDLGLDLSDHRNREAQIWSPDGLWAKLENELGYERAQKVALDLTSLALRSDPLGLPRMSAATVLDYFDDEIAEWRLFDDFGRRPPDENTLDALAQNLRYDARGLSEQPGLIGQAFLASRWWLTAVLFLLAPVALVSLVLNMNDPIRRPVALTVGFASLGLVASHFLFSHIVSFRYLHTMPVFLFMMAALSVSTLMELLKHRLRTLKPNVDQFEKRPLHSALSRILTKWHNQNSKRSEKTVARAPKAT